MIECVQKFDLILKVHHSNETTDNRTDNIQKI